MPHRFALRYLPCGLRAQSATRHLSTTAPVRDRPSAARRMAVRSRPASGAGTRRSKGMPFACSRHPQQKRCSLSAQARRALAAGCAESAPGR
eukprot:4012323-Prymnesium_polylepis.1